ncbi:MAG: sel1 repeat family protein [Terricaulis sp.]|nr:sel1 repeat family protein [Terricaulis sp.]
MFGRKSALDRGLDAFESRNWKRARRHLEEAQQNEQRAAGDYHLGLLYWRGLGGERQQAEAVALFERAAASGHSAAQTAYAMALRAGTGTKQDLNAARALFREAAGAGDKTAMVELAAMSPPDDARYWMLRAGELGHAPAMVFLADILMRREPIEALAWLYTAATISGEDAPRKRAAALAREMSAAEIDEAQKLGRARAKSLQNQMRERR